MHEVQRFFLSRALVDTEFDRVRFNSWPSKTSLVVSTNSLGEMLKSEVAAYIDRIESALMPGGMMYLVQRRKRNPGVDFEDYPIRRRLWWFDAHDFVFKAFVEVFAFRLLK